MKTKIIGCLLFIALFVYAASASAFLESANNNYFGTGAGGTSGSFNSFFGAYAGDKNTGSYNTFIGEAAGFSNSTGSNNTFIGEAAGFFNTTGSDNTFIGDRSGFFNSGSANTFIGDYAGYNNSTGIANVFLGNYAGYNETGSNKLYIDNSNTSSPLIWGDFSGNIVIINGYLGVGGDIETDYDLYVHGNTYVDSDQNLKKDIKPIESSLNKILDIQGVSFKWNEEKKISSDISDKRHYGVIAQQVERVLPEIVVEGKNDKKSVAYMELIPVLIEAVKEQQKTISQLTDKVKELEHGMKFKGSMAMANSD